MTLTEGLVTHIRRKPVGTDDLRAARFFVLDTLACAVGAANTEPARMLRAVARPESSDLPRTAFLIGGLAHILEMDDLHRNSVTHPGSIVVPAALAVARDRDLRGHAFLRAVLAGYEAMTRIGNAVGKAHYRIWHNTSTCGPFGSAMAACDLLGLPDRQTVWALGNAGTQSSGLWEFLAEGAMSKHLHTARAAESGVLAALLAAEGFTGPAGILEGEKGFFAGLCSDPAPDAVLAEPDAPWELTRTSIKPWPCCRHTHPAIDAALELHHRLDGRNVGAVSISTYRAAIDVCDRRQPRDPYSAKFSLQHCVAAALSDGAVTQTSFGDAGRARYAPLAERVSLGVGDAFERSYPDAWGAEVSATVVGGEKLVAQRRACKGDPENPLAGPDLEAKARMLCEEAGFGGNQTGRFLDSIERLADDHPVKDIVLPGIDT